MGAIFSKLIDQLNSSIFILLALLVIAFWVVWKLSDVVSQFKHQKEKNTKIDNTLDSIKETMFAVKATTDLLYQNHLSTVQSHSPLSLTTVGNAISTDLKIDEKVAMSWDKIQAILEAKKLSNPYDIQTVAMELATSCFETIFSEEQRNEIKLYAYQKGKNLLEIIPIIGIIIRDKYLKEKNIPTETIDKYAPKK